MFNLSRLHVAIIVTSSRLENAQRAQAPLSKTIRGRKCLKRHRERVATEQGNEPRNASRGQPVVALAPLPRGLLAPRPQIEKAGFDMSSHSEIRKVFNRLAYGRRDLRITRRKTSRAVRFLCLPVLAQGIALAMATLVGLQRPSRGKDGSPQQAGLPHRPGPKPDGKQQRTVRVSRWLGNVARFDLYCPRESLVAKAVGQPRRLKVPLTPHGSAPLQSPIFHIKDVGKIGLNAHLDDEINRTPRMVCQFVVLMDASTERTVQTEMKSVFGNHHSRVVDERDIREFEAG